MAKSKSSFLEDNQDIIIKVIALTGGYFLVIKPILSKFGLDSTQQDQINQVNALSAGDNPFLPGDQSATTQDSPAKYKAYYQQVKSQGQTSNPDKVFSGWGSDGNNAFSTVYLNNIYALSEIINDSFTWYEVKVDPVLQVFNEVTSKAQVGDISNYLYYNYEHELWTLLKNGNSFVPLSIGLYSPALAQVSAKVLSLPEN